MPTARSAFGIDVRRVVVDAGPLYGGLDFARLYKMPCNPARRGASTLAVLSPSPGSLYTSGNFVDAMFMR